MRAASETPDSRSVITPGRPTFPADTLGPGRCGNEPDEKSKNRGLWLRGPRVPSIFETSRDLHHRRHRSVPDLRGVGHLEHVGPRDRVARPETKSNRHSGSTARVTSMSGRPSIDEPVRIAQSFIIRLSRSSIRVAPTSCGFRARKPSRHLTAMGRSPSSSKVCAIFRSIFERRSGPCIVSS